MEIRVEPINVRGVRTFDIDIPDVTVVDSSRYSGPPVPVAPPVTVNIGVPIVDIPGCVEAHETNNPKNNQVKSDDERGLVTYCDAGVPSYDPISFEPEQIVPTYTPNVDTRQPERPEQPDITPPKTNVPAATANVECPTAAQEAREPVGTFIEGFRKEVIGYKLIGNECVQQTKEVPLPKQIVAGLPSGGQVVQVGSVAVIATTSALLAKPLADLLLKAVKPAVKKVMKKIAALRGKKTPPQSVKERQAEQRQMTAAVRALRSLFPRKKKK